MTEQWIRFREWLAAQCSRISASGMRGGAGRLGLALLLAHWSVPVWGVWHHGYAIGLGDGVNTSLVAPVCRLF